jgi:UDP-N-acetylglucosamine acyltransferase
MIHPTAIIGSDVRIDQGVSIGAYSVIESDVEIRSGTTIGAHSFIGSHTYIGKNNQISNSVSLGGVPQDKKFNNEKSSLRIGNGNSIREFTTINRGTADGGGQTLIADGNWIMAYVHIAHDCLIGNNNVFANKATLAGHVKIADYIILGGSVNIHQFVKVASYAFLSANSYVNMDVLPFIIVQGIPAKTRGINVEGLRRNSFSASDISDVKKVYRLIFKSKLTLSEAIEPIRYIVKQNPKLKLFIEAIDSSDRGITR